MAAAPPAVPDEGLVVRLPAGAPIIRVHWQANGPVWFGPAPGGFPGGRFDAPGGQYGTLYAAQELVGAFAETVLRKAQRIIAWPLVAKRACSVLTLEREITLAQLHGDGLLSWGVTGDICTGDDYGPSQALSLALHGKGLDGIAYRSRHNNDHICYALFDRVEAASLLVRETTRFDQQPKLADALVRRHKAVWDPLTGLPPLANLA